MVDREVLGSLQTARNEYQFNFADGTSHSVLITKFPVLDAESRPLGIASIGVDVTGQRDAEEQLRQAQKMEAVGQLTGGVAHDFNNLLAVILGSAELLEEQLSVDETEQKALIDTILRTAARGGELTQSLLAFSRKQALEPKAISLAQEVAGMLDLLHRSLGETIDIETSHEADLWQCMADPVRVEVALLNLAINARDAMPDGGTLTIDIANAIRALLHDQGSGRGLGARPEHGFRLRQTVERSSLDLQRTGSWDDRETLPATGRKGGGQSGRDFTRDPRRRRRGRLGRRG
jgi:signal transduction histidine kinase/general stress protein YciG